MPWNVLAHFRAATGLEPNSPKTTKPARYSSKVNALLNDLPRDERSVVFAVAKQAVLHLGAVLQEVGLPYSCLFTGQTRNQSQAALQEWKRNDKSVLIIQTGAAASGLTLTESRKVFLMEPLEYQEEEEQAYARCHRYGQGQDVSVKCYYCPVSIESRLLEWRKESSSKNKNIVYASLH